MSRLPRWVEWGAFVLALIAGTVNAVGLLGFEHQAVAHLSGTVTLLGSGLASGSGAVITLAGILLSFVAGAALSGYFIPSESLKLGRHYDGLLLVEAALLLLAALLLTRDSPGGHYLASAACGLQNALATRYSNAIVRTTHVTGIFTDLGIMLGGALRGERFDRRKALLLSLVLLGFTAGGGVGALLFVRLGFDALLVPAAGCLLLAVIYRRYRKRLARKHPG